MVVRKVMKSSGIKSQTYEEKVKRTMEGDSTKGKIVCAPNGGLLLITK